VPWRDGVWTLADTPLIINLQQLTRVSSSIAWIVTHTSAVILPLCLIMAGVSILALMAVKMASILAAALVPLMIVMGLSSFSHDPRFGGDTRCCGMRWTSSTH